MNFNLEGKGKEETSPSFPETSSFLKRKEHELRKSPTDLRHSNLLAFEVAKHLIEEGGNPEIWCIQAIEAGGYRDSIAFKKFPEITLPHYSVCVNEGIVFDPGYGEPVTFSQYSETAFTRRVEEIPMYPNERIQKMLKK